MMQTNSARPDRPRKRSAPLGQKDGQEMGGRQGDPFRVLVGISQANTAAQEKRDTDSARKKQRIAH